MKVIIRNEHGMYLRRISPDGTPQFSDCPLDAWQWDWSEDEVAIHLREIQRRFSVSWTAETIFNNHE